MGRKNVGFLDKKFCKNEKSIWKIVQILWISFFMSTTSDILIIPLKIYVTFTKTLNLKVNFLSKKLEAVSEFFKCSNQEVLCKRLIFKLVFLTTSAVHRFWEPNPFWFYRIAFRTAPASSELFMKQLLPKSLKGSLTNTSR